MTTSQKLSVVCFKWAPEGGASAHKRYRASHVNALKKMIDENLTIPHQLYCVTDDSSGLDPGVRAIPLPSQQSTLPMQYPKLWLFSTQVSDILGDRLLYLDLDVVVTGNFDRLIPNEYVDFKIWAHKYGPSWLSAFCSRKKRNQRAFYNARKRYNSSLIYLRAGSRSMVYDRFTEAEALAIKQKYQVAGSDQVWIYYALGPGQETWTSADGVYSYHRDLSDPSILPDDAKLVFFPGRWNPWDPEIIAASPWVTQHYPPQRPQR